jgi:hypothetical protein
MLMPPPPTHTQYTHLAQFPVHSLCQHPPHPPIDCISNLSSLSCVSSLTWHILTTSRTHVYADSSRAVADKEQQQTADACAVAPHSSSMLPLPSPHPPCPPPPTHTRSPVDCTSSLSSLSCVSLLTWHSPLGGSDPLAASHSERDVSWGTLAMRPSWSPSALCCSSNKCRKKGRTYDIMLL